MEGEKGGGADAALDVFIDQGLRGRCPSGVVSELRKGPRANVRVRSWFEPIDEAELFLSVLVVGELRQGVERLRLRDAAQAERLDRWLQRLIEDYAASLLPIDDAVAELWGRLNVPQPISTVDGLLAATALIHDLTLPQTSILHTEFADASWVLGALHNSVPRSRDRGAATARRSPSRAAVSPPGSADLGARR